MLSKAVPSSVYELALSARNTTTVGIIYVTLKTFQPGGLHERSELLKDLTNLETAQSIRDRARGMNIAVPDCSLLIDGLDRMSGSLLAKHPNLLFRMHAVRMQLQIDTVPTMATVEQWARSLQAELEILAVSGAEQGPKRPRVASVQGKGKDGDPSAKAASAKRLDSQQRAACRQWGSDAGCKRGKNCQFAHTPEKVGKCWVCGGNHQKAECTAPGGGKGPPPEPRQPKGEAKSGSREANPKAGSKAPPNKSQPVSQQNTADTAKAIREATQLLQSMRIAALRGTLATVSQLQQLSSQGVVRGLIDGGATCCLRTASQDELKLPTTVVQLAAGECRLHMNVQHCLSGVMRCSGQTSIAQSLTLSEASFR